MSTKKSTQHPVDYLLKETLKDDLTPEVESRLNIKLNQFREKIRREEEPQMIHYRLMRNFFNSISPMWRLGQQLIKNAAVTFAFVVSFILIAAASLVPITGSPGILAESISVMATSMYVSRQISRGDMMQCSGEAVIGNGESVFYSIKWTPGRVRIHILNPEKIIIRTLLVENDQVTIIDKTNNTLRHGKVLAFYDDPWIQPIIQFISPGNLKERLQVKWTPRSSVKRGDCDEATFIVSDPLEKEDTEVMVDMCTFLPTRIIKYQQISTQPGEEEENVTVLNINFKWQIQYVPRLIDKS